jgi:hypothetical protein
MIHMLRLLSLSPGLFGVAGVSLPMYKFVYLLMLPNGSKTPRDPEKEKSIMQ